MKLELYTRKQFILALLALWAWFSSADYLIPYQRPPKASQLYMNWENQFYYSQSNFLNAGEYDFLKNSAFIAFADYKFSFVYRPYSWLKLTPHFRGKTYFNSAVSANQSGYIPFQPASIGAAMSYPLRKSIFGLQPEAAVSFPLDSQNNDVQRLVVSDESLTADLSLLCQIVIKRHFIPFVKVGVQYRGKELLSLAQWQAGLKYRDRVWELGVLLGGQNSLAVQSMPSSKKSLLDKYNAGSLKFLSVSPFSIGSSAWMDVRLNKRVSVFALYGLDLYGAEYAQGHTGSLGLKVLFIKKHSKRAYKRRNRQFREEREEVDSFLTDESDQELMREIEKLQ